MNFTHDTTNLFQDDNWEDFTENNLEELEEYTRQMEIPCYNSDLTNY